LPLIHLRHDALQGGGKCRSHIYNMHMYIYIYIYNVSVSVSLCVCVYVCVCLCVCVCVYVCPWPGGRISADKKFSTGAMHECWVVSLSFQFRTSHLPRRHSNWRCPFVNSMGRLFLAEEEIWFDCVERETCNASLVCNGSLHVRCCAVVPGVLACVHIYILYVCVYICVCVYVCGHVYMYIYACVCVFVHQCVYTRVYVYVYACLCIDCGSCYQCFSVWTVSCMRMCFRVHMY